jgi:putative transposase
LVRQVRPHVCRRPEATACSDRDKWHLDEVFLNINGVRHYLSRAVDHNVVVIDILVQPRRDRLAAIRFFRKLFGPLAIAIGA